MMIRSLFAWVVMAALMAGPAAAGSIYLDSMDDFEKSWFKRWNSTAASSQGAGTVTLSGAADSDRNRLISRHYISTHQLTRIVIDNNVTHGGFELSAVMFGTVNGRSERIGILSLGRDVSGVLDLSGFNWGAAEEIRLRLDLDSGAELQLDRIEVHASAAPEPSAALLMGVGFLVTGAHMRFRSSR